MPRCMTTMKRSMARIFCEDAKTTESSSHHIVLAYIKYD